MIPVRDKSRVCPIGHSNRPIKDFIGLLWTNQVTKVIDVRTLPRSLHHPQFNLDSLPAPLAVAGIDYLHMPGLGACVKHTSTGRTPCGISLRSVAKRDYMQSADFAENVDRVVELTRSRRCALMCAEAVPWRFLRSMIDHPPRRTGSLGGSSVADKPDQLDS